MTRSGRQYLVTGGASGIGKAVCTRLAESGASLLIGDIDEAGGRRVADELCATPGAARFVRLDVRDPESWTSLVEVIQSEGGRLDGLVNNAGIVRLGTIADTGLDDWTALVSTMLDGVFLGVRSAAPLIAASGGGAIVNVGSRHAVWGAPGEAAYAAVKAAAGAFTRAAAREWARAGVRINSVLPGPTATAILDNLPEEKRAALGPADDLVASVTQQVPLGRVAAPHEIAACICFLLSDDASFVVGADFLADGGISA